MFAQLSTGKIEGTVRDKDSGQPLVGAQVVVEGTRLGRVTNEDGYYFILNVSPGRRSITFTFTGYQKTTITDQLILAGQTTTIDVNLSSTVVQLEGITIEGESEVLLPRDYTVTKQRMTAENIASQPATKLEDLMILEAGVQIGGEGGLSRGLRLRGGRLGEEGMIVDGVMVRNYTANPFRSGRGWTWEQELGSLGEDTTPLELSTGSVEEVDIITGGFQAEYGNAQSGIINIVTKEGGPSLKGNVRFTTDEANPRTADYGYNQLQASLSGPVFGIPNLFFYSSGEIQGMADMFPTHADEGFRGVNQAFVDHLNDAVRSDPVFGAEMPSFTLEMFKTGREFYAGKTGKNASLYSPPNPVRQPNNWGDRTLASGKLTYSPIKSLKIIGGINFSRIQRSYPNNYFETGRITPSMIPTRNWAADPDTVVIIPQSYGRRTRTANLLLGFDWDMYQSAERSGAIQFRFSNFRIQDINSSNLKDNYTRDKTFMSWTPHDIPFEVETFPNREWPIDPQDIKIYFPDGVTGWNHASGYGYETPFNYVSGAELYWMTYRYMYEKQDNYKVDFDFQLNRKNRAKLGFQTTLFGNHQFDITHLGFRTRRELDNEFNYKPRLYAFYVQNRTDLGDFVFDYGLRYDSFKPRTNWGFRYGDQWGETFFPENLSELSPRFDVAFPVTDKSQLRFAYGVFTQLPSMIFLFSGSNPGGLDYSRTDAYEAGLTYLISNDLILDLVAYYRDIDGNLATKEYFRDYWMAHTERRVRTFETGYTNKDNGNIKGMDMTVRKRFSNNFSLNLMYTLQFSRTTGSQYNSYADYWIFMDPTTGEHFTPPDELRPINGDRAHKISANFTYLFPQDFKTGNLANTILRDFRINTIFTLQSGQPVFDRIQNNYENADVTWLTRRNGIPIGGLNYFRERWKMNVDLRLSKSFLLFSNKRLMVFGEIFNLLNRKDPASYPAQMTFQDHSHVTGGVDWNWDDPALTAIQRVRFNADFNGDGILTVEEAAKGDIAASFMGTSFETSAGVMSSSPRWQSWGLARQIRLGLDFNF
ncbi:MAG TPA: carboxypeptidase regulatory-like domain-containing protein [archaeon]|nr:carboxypeptidase regulatory-like domain-containing protein [archaeon]